MGRCRDIMHMRPLVLSRKRVLYYYSSLKSVVYNVFLKVYIRIYIMIVDQNISIPVLTHTECSWSFR